MVARDGERRLIAFSAVLVRDENGAPDHVIATGIDITDRKRSEREIRARAVREAAGAELGRCGLQGLSLATLVDQALGLLAEQLALDLCEVGEPEAFRHNALHDSLTGLPNRALFLDRLGHVLTRRDPGHPHAAVMFLDIDNFKLINDSLGHDAGDRLLKAIGPRLDTALRPIDTVARFGGDEFVVLCEDVHDGRDAVIVAERLQRALAEPFPLDDGEDHFLSASIGVVLATGRYEDPDALLRDADAAMYRAKARGRAQSELFDDAMRNQVLGRLRMENALRGVLDRDELRVFYQPIVSLDDGSIQGFEALMRWHHDGLGPVSPLEFIPIAEETGLIVRLGAWVLEEACRQSVCWAEELGVPAPMVSVNLSPRQVAHAELVP